MGIKEFVERVYQYVKKALPDELEESRCIHCLPEHVRRSNGHIPAGHPPIA